MVNPFSARVPPSDQPGEESEEQAPELAVSPAAAPFVSKRVQFVAAGIVMAVAFVLAGLEFRVGFQSFATAHAWRSAADNAIGEGTDFHESELPPFIWGKPSETTKEARGEEMGIRHVRIYSWKSLFTTYVVRVYLGIGIDHSVEMVEGPVLEDAGADASAIDERH